MFTTADFAFFRFTSQLGQESTSVPWIPFDVCGDVDREQFPDFVEFGSSLAVDVSVKEGELLYLPAMWYHRVAQKGVSWIEIRISKQGRLGF